MSQNTVGDSALECLENIGVDIVKLDKQYILSTLPRGRECALLRAIAGLCKELSILIEHDDINSGSADGFRKVSG